LRGCFAAEKPVWARRAVFFWLSEKRLKNASFGVILAFLEDFGV